LEPSTETDATFSGLCGGRCPLDPTVDFDPAAYQRLIDHRLGHTIRPDCDLVRPVQEWTLLSETAEPFSVSSRVGQACPGPLPQNLPFELSVLRFNARPA